MLSLILLASCLAFASSAPAPEPVPQLITPADVSVLSRPREVLVLTPQLAHQYKDAIQVDALGRLHAPSQERTVVLYPNVPLYPNERATLRQFDPSSIQSTINQFNDTFNNINSQITMAASDFLDQYYPNLSPTPGAGEKIELNPEAETFNPPAVAAPAPLPMPMALPSSPRVYTVAGVPQFFGNFDFLRQNAINPIISLQPLQAIRARCLKHEEEPILAAEKTGDTQPPAAGPLFQPNIVPIAIPLKTVNTAAEDDTPKDENAARFSKFLTKNKILAKTNLEEEQVGGDEVPEKAGTKPSEEVVIA